MGQTWTDNTYQADHTAATDLQNIETNFATLKSSFSGNSSPSNAVNGMIWKDLDNDVLKVYIDGAWRGLMHGDGSQKIWVYRNTAIAGWTIFSTAGNLCAFKGGSYPTGGTSTGSWTISGISTSNNTINHSHSVASHNHTLTTSTALVTPSSGGEVPGTTVIKSVSISAKAAVNTGTQSSNHNHAISSNGTWRPLAYVGTLQGLNV